MVDRINSLYNKPLQSMDLNSKQTNSVDTVKFDEILTNALKKVDEDVKVASNLSDQLATGNVQDLHQVMLQMEKANIELQLTVQVRNKVVEAYQEIMRMQV